MSYGRPRQNRRQGNRRDDIKNEIFSVGDELIKNSPKILNKKTKEDVDMFINLSESFGRLCTEYRPRGKKISTTQIRGIFQQVKRLSDDFETSRIPLNLLRPKLAYQTGRFEVLEPLTKVLTHMIKNVKDDTTLKGFKDFFEAIIAYHKAYGGE
ncbi:hypothetical protein LCGC14_2019110 [marine sediment metagenome]|uniref:CRISPR system Cms protein Csm2 n=1 Tax=marine sediment metagenome TaxID=412755 RepID=A0A0F9FKJ5_9ZZZZ